MTAVKRTLRRTSACSLVILVLLVGLVAAPVPAARADTVVGGSIGVDTTWTLAGSPYIATSGVDVLQGVTLTIEPGVVVKFETGGLLIDGTLVARGTASQPITFTSNQQDPQPGDWGNIGFSDKSVDATFDGAGNYAGGSIMQYCVVEYGHYVNNRYGAIRAVGVGPFIDHCTVRYNDSGGMSIEVLRGQPTDILAKITNNTVHDNDGTGIGAYGSLLDPTAGAFEIVGNTVSSNGSLGITTEYVGLVTDNTVTANGGTGIIVKGLCDEPSFVVGRNTVTQNSDGGIEVKSCALVEDNVVSHNTGAKGAGITAGSGTVIRRNLVSNNEKGGIYASLSTISENTVTGNSGVSGGGIDAERCTVSGNIVTNNTAHRGGGIRTDLGTVRGNVVVGNHADWDGGGVHAFRSEVLSNTIAFNSSAQAAYASGLHSEASNRPIHVLYNTIVGNTGPATGTSGGVSFDPLSGAIDAHHNSLFGNSPYDAQVESRTDVSGTLNYWGSIAYTEVEENIWDWHDDPTLGRLFYFPILEDPDPRAPVPPPLNAEATWGQGTVTLSWDAIPGTQAEYGYQVHYGTGASGPPFDGTGLDQGDSPIAVGSATELTLTGLEAGTLYYLAVTALDEGGVEGWYSVQMDNEAESVKKVYLPLVIRE